MKNTDMKQGRMIKDLGCLEFDIVDGVLEVEFIGFDRELPEMMKKALRLEEYEKCAKIRDFAKLRGVKLEK